VTGFEPATPASRTQCSSHAELHPDARRNTQRVGHRADRGVISSEAQEGEPHQGLGGRGGGLSGGDLVPHARDYLVVIMMTEDAGT
jgi:hypothetical protein